MTIGRSAFVVVIILMVILGRVKICRWQNLRCYIVPFRNQQVLQHLRCLALCVILEEHSAAVLRTYIWSLTVALGRIMCFKKHAGQFLKAHLRGIKHYVHCFIVSRTLGTYFAVRWILYEASRIPTGGGQYAWNFLEVKLGPPETS